MRALIHDFAGHPFTVQLSRELARCGLEVLHVYSGSNPMPQGGLEVLPTDPANFDIRSIILKERIVKSRLLKRRQQDVEHGEKLAELVREFRPNVVLSANSPLDTQNHLWKVCQSLNISRVFWLQDITGVAIRLILGKKLPVAGEHIGRYYERMERRLLRQSEAIVAITPDFVDVIQGYGISRDRVHVIENWGPLRDVEVMSKSNPWSVKHGLDRTFNFIYSGSLGMKHDPSLLSKLALSFKDKPEVRVVVITEGIGRWWLEDRKKELGLDNLILMDFVPFEEVSQVMGASDVMTAILEPDAGVFSVPSKVFSYLCAQRPVLLSVPKENLAARVVHHAQAGLTSNAGDDEQYLANAQTFYSDTELRHRLGASGRKYAETVYDVEAIAERFIKVFEDSSGLPAPSRANTRVPHRGSALESEVRV